LYSNKQQKVDAPATPSIPSSSMPPLLLSASGSGVGYSTCASNPSALQSSSGLHSKIRYSKPPPSLKSVEEEQFLKTLCTVEPFSQDAQDLIDDILSGESELFKLPTKSQVPLLYKALQNIWCQSVHEFFP